MRSKKMKLLLSLAAVAFVSGFLAANPASAAMAPAPDPCPNQFCSPQPSCSYDPGWICFQGGGGCEGNVRCE